MSKHFSKRPLALALSTVFALGATAAQASVFQTTDLASGYMVAAAGDAKTADAKAPEAKCGADCMKKETAAGMSEAEARRQALLAFGGRDTWRERARDVLFEQIEPLIKAAGHPNSPSELASVDIDHRPGDESLSSR